MRSTIPFTSLAFIIAGFAGVSFAQARLVAVPPPPPPQAAVEILDQPESPLQFSVDERAASRFPVAALKVTNVGQKSVSSFVVVIKDGPGHYSLEFLLTPLDRGADRMQIIPSFSNANRDGMRPVSFDFVGFSDGTSWGADTLGKSKQIADFYRGRNLGLAKLKELLTDQDPADFLRPFEVFRSSGFGGQITNQDPRERDADYAARGYEQVIDLLRKNPKRGDESKEFARKLELMEKTVL